MTSDDVGRTPRATDHSSAPGGRTLILFDLDGTLLDTRAAILVGLRHALEAVPGGYERLIGFGMPEVMTWRLTEVMERIVPGQAELCGHRFARWYREHSSGLIRPFPGVPQLLERLRDTGAALGIVSNKGRERVLKDLGLLTGSEGYGGPDDTFTVVVTAEDTAERKPAPDPLQLALERSGFDATDAVHVGDAPQDARSAASAGVRFVGAAWGYYGGDALSGTGHDAICSDVGQLGVVLEQVVAADGAD